MSTEFLATLAAMAAIIAAVIATLSRLTPLSKRRVALVTLALGAVLGVVAHFSGFLDTAAPDPLDIYLSAFWGVLGAFAGAGASSLNLASALTKKEGK